MEITAGKLKGMPLASPDVHAPVRPTSVRARQAFFDSLGDLSGKTFADLCAGSGAMGLEAISRGAANVIFAEKDQASLRTIRKNIQRAERVLGEISSFIAEGELPGSCGRLMRYPKPDILFADPPYADSADILPALTENEIFTNWAEGGKLYWEFPPESCAPLRPPKPPWKISQIRNFGAVRFLILEVFR